MPALVGLSTARAGKFYALVFPRDTWWIKLGTPVVNFLLSLRPTPFRIFAHSTAAVDALVRSRGFRLHQYRRFFIWQMLVYRRQAEATPTSALAVEMTPRGTSRSERSI